MFRLTREVRLTLTDPPPVRGVVNGHAGWPALERLSPWVALRVTVGGGVDDRSGYLLNITEIDRAVRDRALPVLRRADGVPLTALPGMLSSALRGSWPGGATLHSHRLMFSPFTSVGCLESELPMIRLSHRFEFSASHRLHSDALSPEENRRTFGKCNNPHGHGHNYELEVTLAGRPDASGMLIGIPELERIVHEAVIEPFDHKHLNLEVPEFRELNPSVENIAAAIYRRLKPRFSQSAAGLASVTVWETPKTWCEYSES